LGGVTIRVRSATVDGANATGRPEVKEDVARTDANGTYQLTVASIDSVVLVSRFPGYAEQKQLVRTGAAIAVQCDWTLEPAAAALDRVNVLAGADAEVLKLAAYPVSVLDVARVSGRANDLSELVNRLSGVRVRTSGGIGSSSLITVRGLEGRRVEVFIDGRPLATPDGTLGLNDFPLQLVKRIEVYKGIVPGTLSGGGIGGAVNIVLTDPDAGLTDVALERGRYGVTKASAVYARTLARGWSAQVAGFATDAVNNYRVQSPFQPGLVFVRDHDRFAQRTAGLEVRKRNGWLDDLRAEVSYVTTYKQLQGVQENVQYAELRGQILNAVVEARKHFSVANGLQVGVRFATPLFTSQLLDTARTRTDFAGRRYPSPNGGGELGFEPNNSNNRQQDIRSRLVATLMLSPNQTLTFTHFLQHSQLHPNDSLWNAFAGRNVIAFPAAFTANTLGFTYEWQLPRARGLNAFGIKYFDYASSAAVSDPLGFVLGGAPERVRQHRANLGVSNALKLNLRADWSARLSLESALRFPDATELYGDNALITRAARLRPERSRNASVGVTWEPAAIISRPRVDLTVFAMSLRDMIALGSGVGFTMGYINFGRVQVRGLEVEYRHDLQRAITLYGNATWQSLRDVQPTVPGGIAASPTYKMRVPNLPTRYANVGLEWRRRGLMPGVDAREWMRVYVDGSYTGAYLYNWQVSRLQDRSIRRAHTLAIGVQQSFRQGALTANAEAANVFDARVITAFNQPLPGRIFRLKARYVRANP